MGAGRSLARIVLDAVGAGAQSALRAASRSSASRRRPGSDTAQPPAAAAYPGDFSGRVRLEYRPSPDGLADPGEIVWAWVPFEEDFTRGKDRPVLILASSDGWLLGLALTSKDHDRDAEQEAGHGRIWFDIGAGAWDSRGRPSEVRLDRVLRIDPRRVRREGAALDRSRFDSVAAALRDLHGWS